jgi:transcription elongation factor SPT5
VPDRPEVVLVKLREIKYKIDRRTSAKDRPGNTVSTKDIVRVVEGTCKVCTVLHVILCSDIFC